MLDFADQTGCGTFTILWPQMELMIELTNLKNVPNCQEQVEDSQEGYDCLVNCIIYFEFKMSSLHEEFGMNEGNIYVLNGGLNTE